MKIVPNKKYSIRETANILDVSEATVGRYIREHKLKAKKERTIGIKEEWRILGSDIMAFINKV